MVRDIHAENDVALRWAAFYDYLDMVKYLVEHGADIHAVDDYALRYAAYNGLS
jgi:ankyrin repeat protein